MWSIIKADFSYNRIGIILAYGLNIALAIIGFKWDLKGVYGLIPSSMIIFFIAIGMMGSESDKERRDRFHVLLPLPLKKVSITRLLFVIFFQMGMFFLLFIIYLKDHIGSDISALWSIFVSNGLILIVINFFIIFSDLNFFHTKKYRVIFLGGIFTGLILLAWIIFQGYLRTFFIVGSGITKSPFDALFFNLICIMMFYFSHIVFIRRKSYLI